jgi:hypothetical protein
MNNGSVIISIIAFLLSLFTLWLTKFYSGKIKMTRPTLIFFGTDGVGKNHKKIFIRTLLYCTADKGQYIQNMFIRLIKGETIQNFNIWIYRTNELYRGAGLFIEKQGIALDHHFLMPKNSTTYNFTDGEYIMQVYIEPIDKSPILIYEQRLILSEAHKNEMLNNKAGVFFDWSPNTQTYLAYSDIGPDKEDNINIIKK